MRFWNCFPTTFTEVATAPVDATHFSHGTATVDRLLERRPSPADAQDVADSKDRGLVDPDGTLKKVPKKFAVKIELAVEALLGAVAPDAEVCNPCIGTLISLLTAIIMLSTRSMHHLHT